MTLDFIFPLSSWFGVMKEEGRPIFKICLATYQLCGPGQVIQASPGLNSLATQLEKARVVSKPTLQHVHA